MIFIMNQSHDLYYGSEQRSLLWIRAIIGCGWKKLLILIANKKEQTKFWHTGRASKPFLKVIGEKRTDCLGLSIFIYKERELFFCVLKNRISLELLYFSWSFHFCLHKWKTSIKRDRAWRTEILLFEIVNTEAFFFVIVCISDIENKNILFQVKHSIIHSKEKRIMFTGIFTYFM